MGISSSRKRQFIFTAGIFRAAADERWKDARCLHQAGRFDGAIYLCGYVLECFLKFVLCERRNQRGLELAEAKQLGHNLVELLERTGLRGQLFQNRDLWRAFETINSQWSPELRYRARKSTSKSSEIFLRDTRDLRNWLETRLRPWRQH